jgi:hypothetical protein
VKRIKKFVVDDIIFFQNNLSHYGHTCDAKEEELFSLTVPLLLDQFEKPKMTWTDTAKKIRLEQTAENETGQKEEEKKKKKENLENTNQEGVKKIDTKYLLYKLQKPETFSGKKGKSQEFLVQIKKFLSVSDFADEEKLAI